jgi:hypothetical protein
LWCRAFSFLRTNKTLKSLHSAGNLVLRSHLFPPFVSILWSCFKRTRRLRVFPSQARTASKPRSIGGFDGSVLVGPHIESSTLGGTEFIEVPSTASGTVRYRLPAMTVSAHSGGHGQQQTTIGTISTLSLPYASSGTSPMLQNTAASWFETIHTLSCISSSTVFEHYLRPSLEQPASRH